MTLPSFDDFARYARDFAVVPVYREVLADLSTPVSVFRNLDPTQDAALLESVEGGETWGRFSAIGLDPGRCTNAAARSPRSEMLPGRERRPRIAPLRPWIASWPPRRAWNRSPPAPGGRGDRLCVLRPGAEDGAPSGRFTRRSERARCAVCVLRDGDPLRSFGSHGDSCRPYAAGQRPKASLCRSGGAAGCHRRAAPCPDAASAPSEAVQPAGCVPQPNRPARLSRGGAPCEGVHPRRRRRPGRPLPSSGGAPCRPTRSMSTGPCG